MEDQNIRRSRLTSVGIGTLLLMSVVLSLFYIFGNSSSILDRTHRIDKKVTNGGITWTGMYVQQSNAAAEQDESRYYELWREEKRSGSVLLVENFPINFFSSVSWEANAQNGVNLTFYSGGSEGGVSTHIIYDHMGIGQIRVVDQTAGSSLIFNTDKNADAYVVSPLIKGLCKGDRQDYNTMPEVTLKGVRIKKGSSEKSFVLARPLQVVCGIFADGTITDPTIAVSQFDDKGIEFSIANSQIGNLLFSKSGFPEVKFK
jgi:hypothetical protein